MLVRINEDFFGIGDIKAEADSKNNKLKIKQLTRCQETKQRETPN